MTLDELLLIRKTVKRFENISNNFEECENARKGLEIITREINLKVMDVTKSKDNDHNMKMYGE